MGGSYFWGGVLLSGGGFMTGTTIALTDVSSQFLLDGGNAGGASQVGILGSGAVFSGLGVVRHRRGLLRLAAGSTIGCGLQLSPSAQIVRRARALLQTDVANATNPAASACGNSIGSTTVASGASLSVDTSCSYGSESWDVAGTTSNYTTSVAATGAVDVQSGGLLVLNTVTTSSNAFSIAGTFTLSGSMEVLVTDALTPGDVIFMKWDDTSCTDITSSVTVYGCVTSCSTAVVASSAGTSCYLRLSIATRTPTPSESPTSASTATPTPSSTPSGTPTPTPTSTPSPSPSPSPTITASPTASLSPSQTASPTPTHTPSGVPIPVDCNLSHNVFLVCACAHTDLQGMSNVVEGQYH